MKFNDLYKNIKNIKYLDYEIDENHNFELFNEVKLIAEKAKKYNLNIIFSGSWGCIFHHSKLFRTIKDIDFYVEVKDKEIWFEILNNEYEFLYPKEVPPSEFFKSQITQDCPVPFQNKKNSKLKIDIIFYENFEKIKKERKMFSKTFEDFNINYFYLHKLDYKHIYNRKKDIDDINFYLYS